MLAKRGYICSHPRDTHACVCVHVHAHTSLNTLIPNPQASAGQPPRRSTRPTKVAMDIGPLCDPAVKAQPHTPGPGSPSAYHLPGVENKQTWAARGFYPARAKLEITSIPRSLARKHPEGALEPIRPERGVTRSWLDADDGF